MDKKLSIIITHYKEQQEIVDQLLMSIDLQMGINFDSVEVIVVNDGRDVLLDFKENSHPYELRYLVKKHENVSVARNFGLDHANGEYVMFCDCDDSFINLYALHMLFSAMKEGYDAISSVFVEEHIDDNGNYSIVRREKDTTFVHGKVYRKKYLIENGYRFNPNLYIHEDGFFNCLALCGAENKYQIETPFYIWKWRNGVTDKSDRLYTMKTYRHMIACRMAICEEVEKRGQISELQDFVCKTIFDSYYDFQKSDYINSANRKYVIEAKKAFREYYVKWRNEYREMNIERIAEIALISRNNAYKSGLRIEQQTISDFLADIMKERY